eukprot:Seg5111.1 transcript_id=Seg5111.1/GoldUCD/mRNA.D3Y31 product="hypothetical protein" protein_id=Seg5111.1/GoldUCD/D3Y31
MMDIEIEETPERNSGDELKKKIHALQKKVHQLKKRKRELLGVVNEDDDLQDQTTMDDEPYEDESCKKKSNSELNSSMISERALSLKRSMATVVQSCKYCNKEYHWNSQPTVLGRYPAVLLHWERYRSSLLSKISSLKDVEWSGDARFDSMGHNAKYGANSMFCNTISKLVHCASAGLEIDTFISDRHKSIAKWIRESQLSTQHYHDLWHVLKGLHKKLLEASKESGNEILQTWITGIRNHWCALSTRQGFGDLILAKWKSMMRHICNKHTDHPDALFPKCAHDAIEERDWIPIGTPTYDRLYGIVMNSYLLKDVSKISSDGQTSCLEGFHSTLNHWHPKATHFSWMGTKCRHAIAVCHFNENVNRERRVAEDGTIYHNVVYPKFKIGEEVVREVAVQPTYQYVQEIKKFCC